jgi:hypothetical protein
VGPGIAAKGILLLRKQLADGNTSSRLCFKDARSGSLERWVLSVCGLDKRCEDWIVEGSPPCLSLCGFAFHLRAVRIAPLSCNRGGWLLVVRANHGASREGQDDNDQEGMNRLLKNSFALLRLRFV